MSLALYADDALFYSKSATIRQSCAYMRRQMEHLDHWLRKWKVRINTQKTEAICFTKHPQYPAQRETIHLQGGQLRWTKSIKYLSTLSTQQDSHDWDCRQREDPPWNGRPPSAVGPTATSLQTSHQHEAAALQNDSPPHRNIRGSCLVSTYLQDDQEGTRSLPEQDNPTTDEHTMVRLPSLHDFITGQARAMYAAAAESKWDHIREWATREAVHPWKIPQLKPLLGLDVLTTSSHSACCREAATEGTRVPAYPLPACLRRETVSNRDTSNHSPLPRSLFRPLQSYLADRTTAAHHDDFDPFPRPRSLNDCTSRLDAADIQHQVRNNDPVPY
ncbi:hypothetical protein J6590_076762 [Homalodisca vitripennis]|nr:hypothetical protein J6590_076762 [Homalodisca vitripennis]